MGTDREGGSGVKGGRMEREQFGRIGLVGVGRMGRPIAENLLNKGFAVSVFSRRTDIQKEMKSKGADIAATPAEMATKSKVILLVVTGWRAVGEVLFGNDGIAAAASKGTIVIDLTTSDPSASRKYAKDLEKRGIDYLDAPMSGGVLGARAGRLLFMVGGRKESYNYCAPVFEAIGKRSIYMGETGNGHLVKIIHNQASLSIFLATCEAVIVGEKLGLSMEKMIDVFNEGNARSYTSEVRFPKFILSETYDMGMSFANQYKDISLAKKMSEVAGVKVPITNCAYRYFRSAMSQGDPEDDFSKILLIMRELLVRS
jgi:3-hydroxyisobutyrate dehydrogenase-like beta-hydroxyacid dehydrogenase